MLAESQVSGLFLRLFGHLTEGIQPKSPVVLEKMFSRNGTHGGATFLDCFYFLLRQRTLYIAGIMNTNTRY